MVFHLEDNNTTSEIDQAILKVLLSGKQPVLCLWTNKLYCTQTLEMAKTIIAT